MKTEKPEKPYRAPTYSKSDSHARAALAYSMALGIVENVPDHLIGSPMGNLAVFMEPLLPPMLEALQFPRASAASKKRFDSAGRVFKKMAWYTEWPAEEQEKAWCAAAYAAALMMQDVLVSAPLWTKLPGTKTHTLFLSCRRYLYRICDLLEEKYSDEGPADRGTEAYMAMCKNLR